MQDLKAKLEAYMDRNFQSNPAHGGADSMLDLLWPVIEAAEKYKSYCVIVREPNAYSAQLDELKEVWLLRDKFKELEAALSDSGPAGKVGTVGWMGGEYDR